MPTPARLVFPATARQRMPTCRPPTRCSVQDRAGDVPAQHVPGRRLARQAETGRGFGITVAGLVEQGLPPGKATQLAADRGGDASWGDGGRALMVGTFRTAGRTFRARVDRQA